MLVGYSGASPQGWRARDQGSINSHHLGLLLAALYWLRVPLRGPCPAGGDRQRLRVPAGALQPPAQLPQPRVLPREADVERGKCVCVGGKKVLKWDFLERFSPTPQVQKYPECLDGRGPVGGCKGERGVGDACRPQNPVLIPF